MHFIDVTIVYALPEKAWIKSLTIRRGGTPVDLIEQSQLSSDFPEIKLEQLKFGVYGKTVDENYLLEEGDRLEIYRPIKADPKEVRRDLAKAGKTMVDDRS